METMHPRKRPWVRTGSDDEHDGMDQKAKKPKSSTHSTEELKSQGVQLNGMKEVPNGPGPRDDTSPQTIAHVPVPGVLIRTATEPLPGALSSSSKTPSKVSKGSLLAVPEPSALVTSWTKESQLSTDDFALRYGSLPAPSVTSVPLNGSILPNKIQVEVHATFWRYDPRKHDRALFHDGQVVENIKLSGPIVAHDFRWQDDENAYSGLIPTADAEKHKRAIKYLAREELYLKFGSCCVTGPPHLERDQHYKILDGLDDSVGLPTLLRDQAIRQICGFIHEHPYEQISLKVYWIFSSVALSSGPGADLAPVIKKGLQRKMHCNIEDQQYIPKSDLDRFLDRQIINQLILEDKSLRTEMQTETGGMDQEVEALLRAFQKRMFSPAPGAAKLLLLCVQQKIDLTYLRHWIVVHDVNDEDFLEKCETDCENEHCFDGTLPGFKDQYRSYFAPVMSNYPQDRTIINGKILPVKQVRQKSGEKIEKDHDKKDDRKVDDRKFDGRDRSVEFVNIDPSHHGYSPNPYCEFALKQFRVPEAFLREHTMLDYLSDPPLPNLVMNLAAWKSRKSATRYKDFLLFPKARCDLRGLLGRPPVPLDKDGVLWFLKQLRGLAETTKSIHNTGQASIKFNILEKGVNLNRTELDRIELFHAGEAECSHQDIKPANILVFEKLHNHHPVLKLSDLGSGYVNATIANDTRKSKGTNIFRGTFSYQAPGERYSRRSDMWALGCVFLEMLMWLCIPGFNQNMFHEKRFAVHERIDIGSVTGDTFWTKTIDGYVRNSAVEDVLRELKEQRCKSMPAFMSVVGLIGKLLEIDHETRMTADELLSELDDLLKRANSMVADSLDYRRMSGVSRGYSPTSRGDLRDTGLAATETAPASAYSISRISSSIALEDMTETIED